MNLILSRLKIAQNRTGSMWLSNPYRIHQRLMMAYTTEPRMLFRIEEQPQPVTILIQSHILPDWERAFGNFRVLATPPEHKEFSLTLLDGAIYRFRLLANPVVKRNGKRLGLLQEEEQRAWITRKFDEAGATLIGCLIKPDRFVKCLRNPQSDDPAQTHLAVWYEGTLKVREANKLEDAVASGIGHAKGYGFGLLSLARVLDN